jgi:prepilin-type N-terminal cleavage/methylation domain-containing protein
MAHKKNNYGFSLIEAVVVAVIVAILAAVAIPIYTGFIHDQEQTTVNNLAETGAAAANALLRRTGSIAGIDSAALNLYIPSSGYSVSVNTTDTTVRVQKGTKFIATIKF